MSGQYNTWSTGEPNNYNGNEDYIIAKYNGGTQWNDFPVTNSAIQGYLVEYGTWTDPQNLTFLSTQKSEVVYTQVQDLSSATIAPIPAYTATGSAVEPSLEVDYFGTALVLGTDYTVTYTDNVTAGTATVTITGIGNYVGTNSATFQVVELTPPSDIDVPANTTNFTLTDTYSMAGYDASTSYKASVVAVGSAVDDGATFDVTTTAGLSFDAGYSSWTGISEVNFIGTPSNIEAALNSIALNTTSLAAGEIKLQVYITSQVDNTFFNPINGHIYKFVSGNISWTDAASAALQSTYEDESGYFVTITSSQEDSYINNRTNATNVWIGLSDKDTEGDFVWEQGPEAGTLIRSGSTNVSGQYNNWSTGEPNNSGGNEDYIIAKYNGGTQWNDFGETSAYVGLVQGYLVEYGTWTDPQQLTFPSTQKSQVVYTQVQDLSNATITPIPAYTATGSAVEPSLEVDYFGTALVLGTDYNVTYTGNVTAGTATVTITGIGNYVGTNSATFQVVELTPPSGIDVPANTSSFTLTDTYSMAGYDAATNYKVSVVAIGSAVDAGATFDVTTTSGLSLDAGYSSWTGVGEVNFIGTPSNIEAALNSIVLNTSALPAGEIKLQVYITSQVANAFFNPINGHIYEFVSGNISWTSAASAALQSTYEGESGYFATITSAQEDSYINNRTNATNVWIGLSDKDTEGDFVWEQGPEAGTLIRSGSTNVSGQYNNWSTGEPNNSGGNEDYIIAKYNGGTQWNDFGETSAYVGLVQGYLVEYGTWTDPQQLTFPSTQKSQVVYTQVQDLSNATITPIPAYTATGSAVEPSLEVDYFGTALVLGTDYNVTYTGNVTAGTATVTITGIGNYVGTNSATFQVVELTPPSGIDVPANTSSFTLTDTYSMAGYDAATNYKVSVVAIGSAVDAGATFDVTTTSGLSLDAGYSSWTGVGEVNFIGTPSNIEAALNSIVLNTSALPAGEIKLQVYITSQVANAFFNPINGHIYEFVSGNISWTSAASAALQSTSK